MLPFSLILIILEIVGFVFGSGVVVEVPDDYRNDQLLSERMFEEQIKAAIERLRQMILGGIPSLGITSLDPLQLAILPLFMDNKFMSGRLILSDLKLEGLAGFNLTKGTVGNIPWEPTAEINIDFDQIHLTSNYNTKMNLFGMIDLYGAGHLDFAFNKMNIDLVLKITGYIFPPLKISFLKLVLTLPSTVADITGLLNDAFMSTIISEQLSDTLTTLAVEEQATINTMIDGLMQMAVTIINPIIADCSITDIITIIGGGPATCLNSKTERKLYGDEYLKTIIDSAADYFGIRIDERSI